MSFCLIPWRLLLFRKKCIQIKLAQWKQRDRTYVSYWFVVGLGRFVEIWRYMFQVKRQGTNFRHSSDLLISDLDLQKYLNGLITLLTSSDVMKNDRKASEAIQNICKVSKEEFPLYFEILRHWHFVFPRRRHLN